MVHSTFVFLTSSGETVSTSRFCRDGCEWARGVGALAGGGLKWDSWRYTYKCFSRQHILSPIVGNPEVGNEIVANFRRARDTGIGAERHS
jgi:hypothetical protein